MTTKILLGFFIFFTSLGGVFASLFDIQSKYETSWIVTMDKPFVIGQTGVNQLIENKFKGLKLFYRRLAFRNDLHQRTKLSYKITNNNDNLLSFLISAETTTKTGVEFNYHTLNIEFASGVAKAIHLLDLQRGYVTLLGYNSYYLDTGANISPLIYNYLAELPIVVLGFDTQKIDDIDMEKKIKIYAKNPKITVSEYLGDKILTFHIATGVILPHKYGAFGIPISTQTYSYLGNKGYFDRKLTNTAWIVLDSNGKETCSFLSFEKQSGISGGRDDALSFVGFSKNMFMTIGGKQETSSGVVLTFATGNEIQWGFMCDTNPTEGGFCFTNEYLLKNNRMLTENGMECKNKSRPEKFDIMSGVDISISSQGDIMDLVSKKDGGRIQLKKLYPIK